jgi:hypothetical protein
MKKNPTSNAPGVALASIGIVTGEPDKVKEPIEVHFNPVSLQLQVNNELKDSGNQQRKQFIAKTTTKLTMDLIFDTTDTGKDVMMTTRKLQAFLAPQAPPGRKAPKEAPPPLVLFAWGTLRFKGIAEGYKETIDFFSANGVPLRSSVNLTLSRQDAVFDKGPNDSSNVQGDLVDTAPNSAAEATKDADAPGAARSVAASNGQESLRFGTGAALTVSASIELKPAVAFATGGAGLSLGGGAGAELGIGAGAGIGISGGAGIGISGGGGIGISGSAGIGVSGGAAASIGGSAGFRSAGAEIGASVSAGISGMARLSATEGAFAGLRVTSGPTASVRLDPAQLMPKLGSSTVATDPGATFQVGGKASFEGAAGLRADVGATGKLTFDAR